jgi:predicted lactoylglutathione lyase
MHSQIFVNLPVKDLKRSVDFFTKLGYKFNPQFTDENATCMILGDNLFAMLLVDKFFASFTSKAILVSKARAAGATVPRTAQDHGFMYAHGFDDLDGHTWELVHMSGMPPQ